MGRGGTGQSDSVRGSDCPRVDMLAHIQPIPARPSQVTQDGQSATDRARPAASSQLPHKPVTCRTISAACQMIRVVW